MLSLSQSFRDKFFTSRVTCIFIATLFAVLNIYLYSQFTIGGWELGGNQWNQQIIEIPGIGQLKKFRKFSLVEARTQPSPWEDLLPLYPFTWENLKFWWNSGFSSLRILLVELFWASYPSQCLWLFSSPFPNLLSVWPYIKCQQGWFAFSNSLDIW